MFFCKGAIKATLHNYKLHQVLIISHAAKIVPQVVVRPDDISIEQPQTV